MHPFFTKLGVPQEIQHFLTGHYQTDQGGNLVFPYADGIEHFGFSFHLVPASGNFWMAGISDRQLSRHVIIGHSAMELIAFLTLNFHLFRRLENLLLLATGSGITASHLNWIAAHLPGRSYSLVFGNDLLGRAADLKVAAGIRGIPVAISIPVSSEVNVRFRCRNYSFDQQRFSLHAFEKASGYRFGMRTYKAKRSLSFLSQLESITL
ncbi:hypothetical protein J7E50_02755 [Pedobacter sp. ISL-68]|uniref:hypothetical protein n=1 Tax=unclassified Pedobacter TaxID=2628915 RepID=UPI001BE54662|nr:MULTISPECIES: hypothetical protein [unclassified Pedobacter]MBT2560140.1 hypothetical protein [Pedobacter sp. ISL-64]MBT2589119.1 hypothetical protein [Pedobacter sp. ISL-68]